jgi:hypothetical protein
MGLPAPTTNFAGLKATLNETQRKVAINAPSASMFRHARHKRKVGQLRRGVGSYVTLY